MIKLEIEGKIEKRYDNSIVVDVGDYYITCNYKHVDQLQNMDNIHCKGEVTDISFYYNLEMLKIEMNIEEIING